MFISISMTAAVHAHYTNEEYTLFIMYYGKANCSKNLIVQLYWDNYVGCEWYHDQSVSLTCIIAYKRLGNLWLKSENMVWEHWFLCYDKKTFNWSMLTHVLVVEQSCWASHYHYIQFSQRIWDHSQCWVYTHVETAWDETRMRVRRVHLSRLTRCQPVRVLSHSSREHVSKSYQSQRTWMSSFVIKATVDYTLVQFSNIFTEYLLQWEHLKKFTW